MASPFLKIARGAVMARLMRPTLAPLNHQLDQVAAVIERTLRPTLADVTHRLIRSMVVKAGYSHTTVRRMWMAFGLQPHRSRTFKL